MSVYVNGVIRLKVHVYSFCFDHQLSIVTQLMKRVPIAGASGRPGKYEEQFPIR